MWNYHYMGYGGFMMWLGFIFIIVVLYIVLKNSGALAGVSNSNKNKTPMDILKERYAKGEITEEEFERMKKNL
ncbi:SHOCT domain-containing protein [Thermotomaculum hydrothermale]|nr:SHOCT domain-containing protein [Thermotomaculum hydrothermale]